jgi:hypothetical protein
MIFTAAAVTQISEGKKTMTRRLVKTGETLCPYEPSHAYAIQPAGGRSKDRLTVSEVRQEKLGDITIKDAKREGHRNIPEFVACWLVEHGLYAADLDVWVISFAKGDLTDQPRYIRGSAPVAPICQARIKLADGRIVKCKRAFQDDQDVCKCGARRPAASEEDHGYTTSPARGLRGEMAAIPASVQDQYALDAQAKYAIGVAERLNERADLSPAERLRRVEEESRRLGVNISGDKRLIAERLKRAERQS